MSLADGLPSVEVLRREADDTRALRRAAWALAVSELRRAEARLEAARLQRDEIRRRVRRLGVAMRQP